jgi:HipA-like C-terminal domain
VERAEVLALKLAKEAGIDAPEAQILGSRDMPVALIERFDRKIVKGRLQRRHVISAQSFLGAQFADEGDYADLVEQMRAHAEAGHIDYYAAAFEHEELRSAQRRPAPVSHSSARSEREREKPGKGR